jgi:hypothetical protein
VVTDPVSLARGLVLVLSVYVLAGLAFAPWFAWRGVNRIDPHAHGATVGFRLVILPGVTALWPLLVWRLLAGHTAPPEERNAHRRAARRRTSTGAPARGVRRPGPRPEGLP